MPHTCDVLLVTEPPRFTAVNGYLQCELVSGGRVRIFWITRHHTQIAMLACSDAFADLCEPNNVCEFPSRHG